MARRPPIRGTPRGVGLVLVRHPDGERLLPVGGKLTPEAAVQLRALRDESASTRPMWSKRTATSFGKALLYLAKSSDHSWYAVRPRLATSLY
jgi:hypothetical protein